MRFVVGQGVLGKIRFVDGVFPSYDRPYLVVAAEPDHIEVLNVSSIKDKAWKLAYPTNISLLSYKPPFRWPSFVKLDSLTRVESSEWADLTLLDSGKTLDTTELTRIQEMLQQHKYNGGITP